MLLVTRPCNSVVAHVPGHQGIDPGSAWLRSISTCGGITEQAASIHKPPSRLGAGTSAAAMLAPDSNHAPTPSHPTWPRSPALAVPPALTDDSFQQDPSGITYVPPPGLLKNDDIPCGDKAKITLVPGSGPKYGSVEMGEGGGFTYTSGNPAKTDSFQYEVDCGDGLVS